MNDREQSYKKAFEQDDRSLSLFMRSMAKFDTAFCSAMFSGTDFTLKLEVRGNNHKMLHSRTTTDEFERGEKPDDGKNNPEFQKKG